MEHESIYTMRSLFLAFAILTSTLASAQVQTIQPLDSTGLTREILALRHEVENIQLNLGKSENQFKRGILVATLGYSVTIAGGLMLGRKYDDLGKSLLVAGGAAGITGTFLMVDAFKFLGRASRPQSRSKY